MYPLEVRYPCIPSRSRASYVVQTPLVTKVHDAASQAHWMFKLYPILLNALGSQTRTHDVAIRRLVVARSDPVNILEEARRIDEQGNQSRRSEDVQPC
jgi:hypothetical protein